MKNSGQALLELGIFGSILLLVTAFLVQIGMSGIYNQNLKMQTFRQALIFARTRNADFAPIRRGEANYLKLVYKPGLGMVDPLSINERSPLVSQASVTWSNNMQADTSIEYEDLPKVDFDIGGKVYTFTTAGFKQVLPGATIKVKVDKPDPSGSGKIWYWQEIPAYLPEPISRADPETQEIQEITVPVLNPNLARLGEADVDNDGEEETLIGDGGWVMDFQEGELDLGADDPAQGLSGEFVKNLKIDAGTQFAYWENDLNKSPVRVTDDTIFITLGRGSQRSVNSTEKIWQAIRLNDKRREFDFSKIEPQLQAGDILDKERKILYVYTEFPQKKSIKWFTPK